MQFSPPFCYFLSLRSDILRNTPFFRYLNLNDISGSHGREFSRVLRYVAVEILP